MLATNWHCRPLPFGGRLPPRTFGKPPCALDFKEEFMATTARQKLRASASRFVRLLRKSPVARWRRGAMPQPTASKVASAFVPPSVPAAVLDALEYCAKFDFVRQPQLDALDKA